MTYTKQQDQLNDELFDVEHEILSMVDTLIDSKWSAPLIQQELEKLSKERYRLHSELDKTGFYENSDS